MTGEQQKVFDARLQKLKGMEHGRDGAVGNAMRKLAPGEFYSLAYALYGMGVAHDAYVRDCKLAS